MFNFQKEVVLNSLDKAAVVETPLKKDGENIKKVRFHDGGEYFAKYIVDATIYETAAIVGKPVEVLLDATRLQNIQSDHIQILIELGLDNDYRGDYGSALYYFRKPVLVDVNTKGLTDKTLAKAFKTAIPAEYKFLNVYTSEDSDLFPMTFGENEVEAPTAGQVLLLGEDSFIKVRNITVTAFECNERCEGSSEEPVVEGTLVADEDNAAEEAKIVGATNATEYGSVKKNISEFGTANYILHNLRLPTYANYRFTSPAAVEMPVAGKNYVQFSFAYCVPRVGFGGMSVVGQTNHSTTLHTFYVDADKAEDFKSLFEDLGEDIEFVEITRGKAHEITILPDKYAATADLTDGKVAVGKATNKTTSSIASEIEDLKNSVK